MRQIACAKIGIEGRNVVYETNGCTVTNLGLGAFKVIIEEGGAHFTQAVCEWPTLRSTIINISPTEIHVILHTPEGKRHIPPLCPTTITIWTSP